MLNNRPKSDSRGSNGRFISGGGGGPGRGHVGQGMKPARRIGDIHVKQYCHVPAPAVLPPEITALATKLVPISKQRQEDMILGFGRPSTTNTGLETPGRKYAYLMATPHAYIAGFEFGQHASRDQYDLLCDWAHLREVGPEQAEHLYDPTHKPAQRKSAIKGRQFLLDVASTAFTHLQILDEVKRFGERLTGVPVPPGALAVRSLFARYYCVEGGSSMLGWGKEGESTEFPAHVDPGSYTIVLTVPTKNYKADGGMELQIIDPYSVYSDKWKNADGVEGTTATAAELAGPAYDASESVKIHPWSYVIMANPLLHQVTSLTDGERLAFIAFLGYEN